MVDVRKLKDTLTKKNMNVETLAKAAGISKATLYRKLKENGENLTVSEVNAITEALGLDAITAQSIFFADFVA